MAPPPPPGLGLLWDWMELDALAIGSGRNETLIAGCVSYFAEYIATFDWAEVTIQGLFVLDEDGWHMQAAPGSCGTAAVDPKAAGLVYVGGWGLQRSLDGGRSWWLPAPDFATSMVNSIALGPSRKPSR